MMLEMKVDFKSADDLAKQAAKDLAERILSNLASKPFHLVLTGGTVGTKTLAELAPLLADVDLSNLQLWWGDERFVDSQSPDRNFLQASQALISKISIPEANLHQMPAAGYQSLEQEAANFASHFEQVAPVFDVVLLGVGPDGHVASLFPDSKAMPFGQFVVAEASSPKPPSQRISLSFSALSSASEVWFLVSGQDKAIAVSKALRDQELPAGRIKGKDITRWYLDTQAAAGLAS
jgi:6-phosphogluconolactonase